MANGKNARTDGRRASSSYCSTVTLVVFVTLCLIGAWLMTSSSVAPVQHVDMSSQKTNNEVNPQLRDNDSRRSEDNLSQETKSGVKQQVTEKDSQQFEDNTGDLPEDAMKGDIKSNNAQNERNSETSDKVNGNLKENEDKKEDSKTKVENNEDETKEGKDSKTENGELNSEAEETKLHEEAEIKEISGETKSGSEENEKKSESDESSGETKLEDEVGGQEGEEGKDHGKKQSSDESKTNGQAKDQVSNEVFPGGAEAEILNETITENGAWATQSKESTNEKEVQQSSSLKNQINYSWKLCNVTAGADYIPCLDNLKAIKKLRSTKHYQHRERHCPEEAPTCLVPLPEGYRRPIKWPMSRDKIWYSNVPHTKLAEIKGHQNWVKVTGEHLTFPGGGTQFKNGALYYIDFIQDTVNDIAWGKRTRVILDVGCGVASFGGYLFERDVLTMSLAPKDEHEAQVQFALERGIPAISAVMGTTRLPFPSRVFDVVHCARCRVPWHIEGGKLLLELNRLLRPGGYFVWSATPVYKKLPEDAGIWEAMSNLTKSMCWDLVTIKKDQVNRASAAIYQKPISNECYMKRPESEPPLCQESDDPNAAWNVTLQACMHKLPVDESERGSQWPEEWPERVKRPPYWLKTTQVGVYGKPAPEDFTVDYEHWKRVVNKSYLTGMGINWATVRNAMDMRSVYGGFAAALKDLNLWVMNVVSIDSPDTLPIIYERGLFGIYHDWCESFSTYPRSYDLLHADHLFSKLKKRCNLLAVMAEVDRILRPEGKLIVRDKVEIVTELETMARSLKWEIRMIYSKEKEGLLCVEKTMWRPKEVETIISAIA